MLREAGATEVHFRVSSPPYRWPCFYGMDTGRRGELLAADMSVGEIREYLGVDSLAYLELDRLRTATGAPPESFCTACLSGEYPVPVALTSSDSKLLLEAPVLDLTESGAIAVTVTDDDPPSPARRDERADLRRRRASTSPPARRPSS